MKFLTGAPASGSLDWNLDEMLNEFLPPFLRLMNEAPAEDSSFPEPSSTSWPLWRRVGTLHMHNDGQVTAQDKKGVALSEWAANQSDIKGFHSVISDEVDTEFEKSFAVPELCDSSQITSVTQFTTDSSLFNGSNFESFENGEDTDYSLLSNVEDGIVERQTFPTNEKLTDLSALPNANYIRRILPGTMTVHIIVGVVSISPLRTVTVRKHGHPYEMDIVDLYVRDETNSGLKISIWFKPEVSSHPQVGLRPLVSRLRRGDAVFFKSIALRTYRGEVCGQSLSSKRYPSTETQLALLSRCTGLHWGGEAQDELGRLSDVYQTKLRRVQACIKQYLDLGNPPSKALGKRKLHRVELPADTQID